MQIIEISMNYRNNDCFTFLSQYLVLHTVDIIAQPHILSNHLTASSFANNSPQLLVCPNDSQKLQDNSTSSILMHII